MIDIASIRIIGTTMIVETVVIHADDGDPASVKLFEAFREIGRDESYSVQHFSEDYLVRTTI